MKVISINRWIEMRAKKSEKLRHFEQAAQYWNLLLNRLISMRSQRSASVTRLAAIHYRLGLTHRALNDEAKSIYHLKFSVRLNSSEPRYYDAFGRAFLSGGHWKVAQAQFDRALELDPKNPALLRRYAWVLMMMGRLKSAKIYARKAVKLRPHSRENSLLLARIFIEDHEYLKAIEVLKPFSRHRQVEKVLEVCKSRLALSYEGAVFQMLLKGMVCDERPFTLNDLKKAQNLWNETLREIPVRSLIGHLPSSWSAALAWLVLQEREKESYFTMDDVAVRFGSATQDIWPCVLRLQEVSSDEGQCRSNR